MNFYEMVKNMDIKCQNMYKKYQNIKIVIDNHRRKSEDIFTLTGVQFKEMLKRPTYLILRFNTETLESKELIIPIISYMKIIIEWEN